MLSKYCVAVIMELVLASASPRRFEILKNAGFLFSVRVANADETLPRSIKTPKDAVEYLANIKSDAIKAKDDEVILSADTVVALGNEIFGKPKDGGDAFKILRTLSGKTHSVYTGVTIKQGEKKSIFSVKTDVSFLELSDKTISDYIKTGEPLDKAGGYGIQGLGAALVEKIDGDYFNVVGLPLEKTTCELEKFGITAKADII